MGQPTPALDVYELRKSFTFFQWKANQKYSNACENDIKFKFQRVQKVLPEQSFVPVIIFSCCGNRVELLPEPMWATEPKIFNFSFFTENVDCP